MPRDRILLCSPCDFCVSAFCLPDRFEPAMHQHALDAGTGPADFRCGFCDTAFAETVPKLTCPTCQFFVCTRCAEHTKAPSSPEVFQGCLRPDDYRFITAGRCGDLPILDPVGLCQYRRTGEGRLIVSQPSDVGRDYNLPNGLIRPQSEFLIRYSGYAIEDGTLHLIAEETPGLHQFTRILRYFSGTMSTGPLLLCAWQLR
jgi:hypothetical protein